MVWCFSLYKLVCSYSQDMLGNYLSSSFQEAAHCVLIVLVINLWGIISLYTSQPIVPFPSCARSLGTSFWWPSCCLQVRAQKIVSKALEDELRIKAKAHEEAERTIADSQTRAEQVNCSGVAPKWLIEVITRCQNVVRSAQEFPILLVLGWNTSYHMRQGLDLAANPLDMEWSTVCFGFCSALLSQAGSRGMVTRHGAGAGRIHKLNKLHSSTMIPQGAYWQAWGKMIWCLESWKIEQEKAEAEETRKRNIAELNDRAQQLVALGVLPSRKSDKASTVLYKLINRHFTDWAPKIAGERVANFCLSNYLLPWCCAALSTTTVTVLSEYRDHGLVS